MHSQDKRAAHESRGRAAAVIAARPGIGPRALAREAGVPYTSAHKWREEYLRAARPDMLERQAEVEVPDLPTGGLPTELLIQRRKEVFVLKKRAAEARRLIPVRVKQDGPIGICWFGDPHIDDDGCNLPQLERDVNMVAATPGMLAGNIGDSNNNWVGRLARLWEQQSTSGKEAWQLVEWLVKALPWLVFLGGNHGAWSGSGDPLQWMLQHAPSISDDMEARFELSFPNGNKSRVFARHDFPGHSQWNPTHGMAKAATMTGYDDSLLVAGHKHTTGYQIVKNPNSGVLSHLARAGGYKAVDRYAKENFLSDHNFGESAVSIFDPQYPTNDIRHVQVLFNVEQGCDFLTYLRKRSATKS